MDYKEIFCEICKKKFISDTGYKSHMTRIHKVDWRPKEYFAQEKCKNPKCENSILKISGKSYCCHSCQISHQQVLRWEKFKNENPYPILICECCKKPFSPTRRKAVNQKYCSVSCSTKIRNTYIKSMLGKHHTLESRRKIRIGAINYLKNNGGYCPRIGKNELSIIDNQEQIDNCKIQRQYFIKELGYTVDGYCKETNTVYEVYEKHHKNVNYLNHDLQRQKEITDYLKCNFIVIKDT